MNSVKTLKANLRTNVNPRSGLGVSVVVSTKRPEFFDNILANFNRQRYKNKELVIVLHNNNINLTNYRKKVRAMKNVSIYQMAERFQLGRCLNHGIVKSKLPLIAKFDDDDYYSPYYLSEQIQALARTGTDVVGKKACYTYLQTSSRLILRFSGLKQRFVKTVSGGTILFRRAMKVRFTPSVSLGEDINFLAKCRTRGYKIYATTPYNYVYLRRKSGHTWKTTERYLMAGSKFIGRINNFRRVTTRVF
ncbi:glycosyltransferase [Paenibacillus sp. YAF4_2]|uniref:glycosyltransferase n=1 Tax=Paenibacillus sp. YAF4_2 TaxID=3233085 RepID=UPI003F94BA0E